MARTLCTVCQVRTACTGKGDSAFDGGHSDMCNPCFTEGGWENTHSDYAHDEILAVPAAERTEEQANEIKGCWICYPELNEAQKEYKPRKAAAASSTPRVQGTRRPQINHKATCLHAQTPEARRACKTAYWAEQAKAEEATK
jgi:hypothetical protein